MIQTFPIEEFKSKISYHIFNLRNSMIAYIEDRIRVVIITAATFPTASIKWALLWRLIASEVKRYML